MMKKILLITVAALLLASFDESITAEAIIRMDNVPDSMYTELNGRSAPAWTRSIVQLNNMHSSCPSGAASCRMKNGRKTPFKVDCHATLISSKMAITSRHCFCHKGKDVAYTSGFTAVVGKTYGAKVKRTWVNRKCEFDCKRPGSHNDCDYAIVEFTKKVPRQFKPIGVWNAQRHGDEMHNTLLMAGFGSSGVAGKMSKTQCATNRQDGKMRAAAFKVEALGRNGNDWGENKYGVLRYTMGKKGTDSRLPEGLAAHDDHGIPAFIMHKGVPQLVGVHAHRVRNQRNMFGNACALGATDEFTRLTSRKTHTWIRNVIAGKTKRKAFFPLLHKYKRNMDQLPLQSPGDHAYPYMHEYGHRRRRSATKRTEVPGNNKCRMAMPHLFRPLKHKITMEVCGGLAPNKWPIEFFDPKFAQKIQPIMAMQHAAYRFDKKTKGFKLLKKNPYKKSGKTALEFVESEHYTLMKQVRNHFRRMVMKAGKLKVRRSKRAAAAVGFRILVPMEKRVKELQLKVTARRKLMKQKRQAKRVAKRVAQGKKWHAEKKMSAARLASKLAASKWPRYKWRHKNNRRMARLKLPSLTKIVKRGKHRRLRVPGSRKVLNWWNHRHRHAKYPRPIRSHRLHTTSIGPKRFSVWKIRAWKKHLHILRKWRAHYKRKRNRARTAKKKACKDKASRACIRLKKRVHRLVAKVHAYHKLMRPYKHAVTRNIEKLWTPSSVVIKAHRYKKKMDKKKLKAKRPTKKKTKKNSAKVKAAAAALASRRRRSWMHFNPFKNSLKKKRAARKKRAHSKGKSKGKAKRQLKLHGTFRSQAKAALGGAHIHIRKRGTYKKLSPDQKCAFYMRQARTLGKAAGSHPLKSTRKGKMLGSVRLPVSMLRKIAHAKKYMKRHCRNGHHVGHDDDEDEYHEDTSDDDLDHDEDEDDEDEGDGDGYGFGAANDVVTVGSSTVGN